jgi:hypothetical protein
LRSMNSWCFFLITQVGMLWAWKALWNVAHDT